MTASRITVYDDQGQALVLTSNDHLATGGEGSVYAKGSKVHKIYLDPAKAVAAGMERKAPLLAQLKHPGIAAPTGLLRDKKGALVGLSFNKAQGDALCRAFTSAWRAANRFDNDDVGQLAQSMRDIVAYAHQHQALLVDGNELNWLVHGTAPTVIDVDSWQLPGFAATAIMPSIRDPLVTKAFSPGSDWFAWAVVTFQLWTGIHPYKGTHPDFARGALQERMKAGVSVFDARVSLPAAARPVSDIPARLRQWYEDVFTRQERMAPPAHWGAVTPGTTPTLRVVQTLSQSLRQEKWWHAPGRIRAAFSGFMVVDSPSGLQAWDLVKKAQLSWVSAAQCQAILRREGALLRLGDNVALLELDPEKSLTTWTAQGQAGAALPTRAQRLWQAGPRVFGVLEGVSNGLLELECRPLGPRVVTAPGNAWPVSALSTEFFRGCFVQDCLGAPFVGVLEDNGMVQARAPELKPYRVVEGVGLDRHNVWLVAVRKADGETVRLKFGFKTDQFVLEEEALVSEASLDGASLASGVGVMRLEQDLRISRKESHKALAGSGLSESGRLFSAGSFLGWFEDREVFKLSLS